MQRCLWRAVGPRKQWAIPRLFTTSQYMYNVRAIFRKYDNQGATAGSRSPERSLEDESMEPSSVRGRLRPRRLRKRPGRRGAPGRQDPQRSSKIDLVKISSMGRPTQSTKVTRLAHMNRATPSRHDPQRSSESKSLNLRSNRSPNISFRIRKHSGKYHVTPGNQDTQHSSDNESLDLNSTGSPIQAFAIKKHSSVKGNTQDPEHPQHSSKFLGGFDSSTVGEQEVDNASAIRLLMRRVPHPVAVITANMPGHSPPESFRGMTVSSFNTVCLKPDVVVSFNVGQPSATYDAIKASGQFNVHLINGTILGAGLAHLFATGRGREAFKQDVQCNDSDKEVSSTLSPSGLAEGEPALFRTNRVMFTLRCKMLDQTVKVGDHVIVLGAVLSYRLPPVAALLDRTSLGMSYVNRRYRRPGLVQYLQGERVHDSGANSAKGAAPGSTKRSLSTEDNPSDKDINAMINAVFD